MRFRFLQFSILLILYNDLFLNGTLAADQNDNSTKILKRGKRYLDLLKNSRMFFRANVKNNVIQVNQLWAHSYGFRANYPIETDTRKRPFRRDVFEAAEDLLDQHGFDGRACILKSFCSATRNNDDGDYGGGMMFKLFKLIFSIQDHEKHHFPHLRDENCQQILHHHCPFTFNSLSSYTDDV